MKKFIAILMMCVSTLAFAGNTTDSVNGAGFNKLSESEKAEIIRLVAEKAATKKDQGAFSNITEDKVDRWVTLGTNIGQGLAGAAKELGVAVNEFSQTSVGKLTVALIVWHMLGEQIVHVFAAIMIWVVGFAVLRYIFIKVYPVEVTYDAEKKNIFGNPVVKTVHHPDISGDVLGGFIFAAAVVLAVGAILLITT